MAVTISAFLAYKHDIANGGTVDLDTDTIKVSLHTSTMAPNLDTWDFADDLTNEVAAGDGYSTGGATLASPTFTDDTTNDRVDVDYADVTWATTNGLSSRYGIVYKSTGTASTSRLIALIDFGATSAVNGLTFNASGLLRFA